TSQWLGLELWQSRWTTETWRIFLKADRGARCAYTIVTYRSFALAIYCHSPSKPGLGAARQCVPIVLPAISLCLLLFSALCSFLDAEVPVRAAARSAAALPRL